MTTLTIRPTKIGGDVLKDDFVVKEDGYSCGRIMLGFMAGSEPRWLWSVNPPLPIPAEFNGNADTLDEAKAAFKAAWERFRASLTNEDVAYWHQIADAARRD